MCVSEIWEIPEPLNQNVIGLDTSDMCMNESGDEHSHSSMNQDESVLDTSGINLDANCHEHSPNIETEPT